MSRKEFCLEMTHTASTSKCQSDLTNDHSASLHPSGRVEVLVGGEGAQREVKQHDERPCGESVAQKMTLMITNLITGGDHLASVLKTQLTLT